MKSVKQEIKKRNFVQMYVQQFNKPQVFKDRKQLAKNGYQKHKKDFKISE